MGLNFLDDYTFLIRLTVFPTILIPKIIVASFCFRAKGFVSGAGCLLLDSKKMRAIKHWLEGTGAAASELVARSQHDLPFCLGAFGESFAGMPQLFLGSKASNLGPLDLDWQPLAGEAFISLDWNLPLSSESQFLLFNRVLGDFQKETTLVDPQNKKRYRKKEEDLIHLRNLFALWGLIRDHLGSVIGHEKLQVYEKKLISTDFLDDDLGEVLSRRPRTFSVTMLGCERQKAQQDLMKQEEQACLDVESQRLEVRGAKWAFFTKALASDHLAMEQVKAAPGKLDVMQHKKEVQYRHEQSMLGQKAVTAYMNKFVRVIQVDNAEMIKPHVMEFLNYMVGFVSEKLGN